MSRFYELRKCCERYFLWVIVRFVFCLLNILGGEKLNFNWDLKLGFLVYCVSVLIIFIYLWIRGYIYIILKGILFFNIWIFNNCILYVVFVFYGLGFWMFDNKDYLFLKMIIFLFFVIGNKK